MNEFPLTFKTVQQGNESSRVVNNRDELIALRSELELLTLSRAGQARLACVALSNATSFEPEDGHTELHELLVDALHPCVVETIQTIDRDFPDVVNEVCRDVLQDEAESFQTDVAVCLGQSTSPKFQELSKTYALSVGLNPPNINRAIRTQDAPSDVEASVPLDESETTMNENANVPDPINEDQTDAVENTLDDAAVPAASPAVEESSGEEVAEFDNVEDALNAMESDLEELQALAGEEGFDDTAAEGEPEPVATTEASTEPNTEAAEEVLDAVENSSDLASDAAPEETPEAVEKGVEVEQAEVGQSIAQDQTDVESPESTIDEPAAVAPDMVPDSQPIEATANELGQDELIQDELGQDESVQDEPVQDEPVAKGEPPAPAMEGLAEAMSANPVAAGILASFSAGGEKADAPKKPTAEELRAELDQALLEDSVASFTEAMGETEIEAPTPQAAEPPPASSPAPKQRFTNRSSASQDRPQRTARPRRTASNHQSRSAESAIENFAGFLVEEVNSMWAEAREGLEEICAVRDEIESIRNEIRRTHQETIGMRDAAYAARKEARHLQSQIQNQRDDANRARQRADAAAVDAQASSDRAAAAAREAESMATMSQPL